MRWGRVSRRDSEVGIVVGFDCEDGAGANFEHGIVKQLGCAVKIGADADGCDHAGRVDE